MSNIKKLSWRTEKRKVKDLVPLGYNPRKLSEERKQLLIASLEKFDLVEIPAINTDNTIIAGHQRIMVLMALDRGDELIDVRIPNRPLTEEELKEYNIRSNVDYGEWDSAILDEFFSDLDLDEIGLDITELPDFDLPSAYKSEKEGEFDPTPPVKPISDTGDLYVFKSLEKDLEHRLLCGNAEFEGDTKKLMGNDKANMVFTDPPYNVNYQSRTGLGYDSPKYGGYSGKIFSDNKTEKEAISFYTNVLKNLYDFTKKEAVIYWWYALKNYVLNETAFKNTGWHLAQTVIWLKENMIFSPGADFHRTYEPFIFGWKKGEKHFVVKKFNNFRDVFTAEFDDYKNIVDVWYERRDRVNDYVHPTQKPIALAERALKRHSLSGFIVIDMFSGSGSTLIACEKNKRNARVMELDPKYVDVTFRRYVQYMRDNELLFEITKNGKKMSEEDINEILNNVKESDK